jgi:hypothetical protein
MAILWAMPEFAVFARASRSFHGTDVRDRFSADLLSKLLARTPRAANAALAELWRVYLDNRIVHFAGIWRTGAMGLEPATSGVTGRARGATILHGMTRKNLTSRDFYGSGD